MPAPVPVNHFPIVATLSAIESSARAARESIAGAYMLSRHKPTGIVQASQNMRIGPESDPRVIWQQQIQAAEAAASAMLNNLAMAFADLKAALGGDGGDASAEPSTIEE